MKVMWFSMLSAGILVFLRYRRLLDMKALLVLLIINLAGTGLSAKENFLEQRNNVTELKRDSAQDAGEMEMTVKTDDGEIYPVTIHLPYEEYTKEEAGAEIQKVMSTLDKEILGKNTSPEKITRNLNLPAKLQDSPVNISWYSSRPDLLDASGVIHGSDEGGTEVILMADLTLQDVSESYRRNIVIFPSEEEDSKAEQIRLFAENMNEGSRKGTFFLPDRFRGKGIRWYRKGSRNGIILSGFALLAGIMWVLRERDNEKKEQEKRNEQMLRDYPGLLSKMQLYLHAGLSMRKTLERIEQSYRRQNVLEQRKKKINRTWRKAWKNTAKKQDVRYAYEEISLICAKMRSGMTELEAYEEFGRRCSLPCYKGLALLLTQNMKRGGTGLLDQLERESAEAFENRKREAKMEGEKAGIRLLLPMCLMLIVVMAMVMVPAMMQF